MKNREIKFRVWTGKEMLCTHSLTIDIVDGAVLDTAIDDYKPDYILMQFTGLLDKNGKEIFEGDILKMEHQQIEVGVVDFIGGGFWIKWDKGQFLPAEHLCEIIGSIHSTPELLK